MKRNSISSYFLLILFTGTLTMSPAYAQSDSNSWRNSAAINLWGAGIKGTTASGAEIDVGFSDILDNLDFAFMGTLEGRKGKWSWLADAVYMNLSVDESGTIPIAGGALGRVDVGVKGWALNLLGGYNLSESGSGHHDVVFGARYLDLETSLKLTVGKASVGDSVTGGIWDGVVGLRGRGDLQGNWYLPYYVDVGTGQSDLTWQAYGGVGYAYNWGDLVFAYRHLEWEFDAGEPIRDINFSGPILQAKWYF